MDRRAFLKGAAAVAGAALAPGCAQGAGAPRHRVIVAGAGLAGLAAAFELAARGHTVLVLEANRRLGGRVHTLRHPMHDGLYAELGGEWINSGHHYIRHYVQQFGLTLSPDEGETALWEGGTLVPEEDAARAAPGLAELRRKIREHAAKINVYEDPPGSPLTHLDRVSYLDYLRGLGASDRAIAFERILVNDLMTVDLEEISALHMLYEFALPKLAGVESRIRGGNTLLIDAFARRLGGRIRTAAEVNAVERRPGSVRVHFTAAGKRSTADAAHVILAMPGTLLRRVRFEPALPAETSAAYAALGYGRILKVVLQARRRFWESAQNPYKGVLTHREAAHVYHSSLGQPGPRGLLTCYSAGWGAHRWGPLGPDGQVAAGKNLVGEIWPAAAGEIEQGYSWHWNRTDWARGSYAFFAPGQMAAVRVVVPRPVENIHFAGEHTAVWQGYMNGAVESGLRAAAEIDPAIGALYDELTAPSRRAA